MNAQYFRKQHVQLPDNLRALKVLDELLPQRGRLLEIGSYLGIFLDRIRADGWKTTGLEPEHSAAAYSRKTYQLNIVEGVLPQPDLAPDSFDAVMMLQYPTPEAIDGGAIRRALWRALCKPTFHRVAGQRLPRSQRLGLLSLRRC